MLVKGGYKLGNLILLRMGEHWVQGQADYFPYMIHRYWEIRFSVSQVGGRRLQMDWCSVVNQSLHSVFIQEYL